jgi:HprK-related kinase B
MTTLSAIANELMAAQPPAAELWLDIGGTVVRVRSSSSELCARLARYFGDVVAPARDAADVNVTLVDAAPPRFPFVLRDWPREAGKLGQKERYADASDGRLVAKVRTGMQFLLTPRVNIAVGPCSLNLNQIVNFIIAQYLTRRLSEGWALCHAAAVAVGSAGLAIAASSGSGKSTLALHLVSSGSSFVSNDRALIRRNEAGCELLGVPKMPRVNPGTLLHNPELASLLSPERREELAALPPRELWQLEEKCDVMVPEVFGRGRSLHRVPLRALLVLSWVPDADAPARFERIDLGARPDLLGRVIKSPGAFHVSSDGAPSAGPDPEAYFRALRDVLVYEATGRVDFDMGVGFCRRLLER